MMNSPLSPDLLSELSAISASGRDHLIRAGTLKALLEAYGERRVELRDQFAAAALVGMSVTHPQIETAKLAAWSYQQADEMLKAREKTP